MLELNILIAEWCKGCAYHEYPYYAQIPFMIDGERPTILFNNDDDVWDIINKLIEETKEVNEDLGKDFNIAKSIEKQIPFFACKNFTINKESQEDISRYLYCSKFKTQPYPGSYSEQPLRWIKKAFIIKSTLGSRSNEESGENKDG